MQPACRTRPPIASTYPDFFSTLLTAKRSREVLRRYGSPCGPPDSRRVVARPDHAPLSRRNVPLETDPELLFHNGRRDVFQASAVPSGADPHPEQGAIEPALGLLRDDSLRLADACTEVLRADVAHPSSMCATPLESERQHVPRANGPRRRAPATTNGETASVPATDLAASHRPDITGPDPRAQTTTADIHRQPDQLATAREGGRLASLTSAGSGGSVEHADRFLECSGDDFGAAVVGIVSEAFWGALVADDVEQQACLVDCDGYPTPG